MMIVLDCKQGSDEWLAARRGIPTASQFSRIVTRGGKLSASRDGYIGELLASWALGYEMEDFMGTDWTERGAALEPQAFSYYSFETDSEPRKVGFVYRDETKTAGCSPDALVGEDGGLELKCPMPGKHMLWLGRWLTSKQFPKEYFAQVQGCLWVTGREWWDFMSYCPALPPLGIRMFPDEKYQKALDAHIPAFIGELDAMRKRFIEIGVTVQDDEPTENAQAQAPEPEPKTIDQDALIQNTILINKIKNIVKQNGGDLATVNDAIAAAIGRDEFGLSEVPTHVLETMLAEMEGAKA